MLGSAGAASRFTKTFLLTNHDTVDDVITVNVSSIAMVPGRDAASEELEIAEKDVKTASKRKLPERRPKSAAPATSVPLHGAGELPVGVQFVAPFGREDRLFALAGQLERSNPWFDRRPSL